MVDLEALVGRGAAELNEELKSSGYNIQQAESLSNGFAASNAYWFQLLSDICGWYDRELAAIEAKGGVRGRTAMRLRQKAATEIPNLFLLYTAWNVATRIGQEKTRCAEGIAQFNALSSRIQKCYRTLEKRNVIEHFLRSMGVNVCRYCLKYLESSDANFCGAACKKGLRNRCDWLKKKANTKAGKAGLLQSSSLSTASPISSRAESSSSSPRIKTSTNLGRS